MKVILTINCGVWIEFDISENLWVCDKNAFKWKMKVLILFSLELFDYWDFSERKLWKKRTRKMESIKMFVSLRMNLPASRWWRIWRTTLLSVNKRMAALWRTERRSKVRFWLCNLGEGAWLSVRHGTAGEIRRWTNSLAAMEINIRIFYKVFESVLPPTQVRARQLCFRLQ